MGEMEMEGNMNLGNTGQKITTFATLTGLKRNLLTHRLFSPETTWPETHATPELILSRTLPPNQTSKTQPEKRPLTGNSTSGFRTQLWNSFFSAIISPKPNLY